MPLLLGAIPHLPCEILEAHSWLIAMEFPDSHGIRVNVDLFAQVFNQFQSMISIREKQRGGETQGRGKHTINPLPKNGFGPPPLMIQFPPPLCSRNVILLRGNGHRPDKSHFLRPPKLVLEGAPYGTFPPPPQIARYVLPPPSRIPTSITFNECQSATGRSGRMTLSSRDTMSSRF